MNLYLIKRGPKPGHHNAPYHPIVICANKKVARSQAGSSSDGSWVWEKENEDFGSWLLARWNGLDIDYGHLVHSFALPDGTIAAHAQDVEPWTLLNGAIWWSPRPIPEWLAKRGVRKAQDTFSLRKITEDHQPY